MEKKYSVQEILQAVESLNAIKEANIKISKLTKKSSSKNDIPKDTESIIAEAEKNI